MDDKKDILKDYFKERLKDYEQPVKRDLWISLKEHVPTPQISWKYIYITVASVAAVLLLGFLIYPFIMQKSETGIGALDHYTEGILPPIPEDRGETTDIVVPENLVLTASSPKTIRQAIMESFIKDITPETEKEDVIHENEDRAADNTVADRGETPVAGRQTPINKGYMLPELKKKKASSFQFSVAGNGLLAMNNTLDQVDILNSSQLRMYSNQMNIGYSNQMQPSVDELTNIKYHLPVTVSLLVGKRLTSRWSVETGISYTRLSSEETWESAELNEISTNNVKLYYLGLPLKVSYSVINIGRFSLYAAGGGMIEKCVSGKVVSTFSNTGLRLSSDLDTSEWQFSLIGNIGAEFEIVKPIGIFVEPGVVYYFDNGSEIMTIRKDKPFNFNIQGGLRLSF